MIVKLIHIDKIILENYMKINTIIIISLIFIISLTVMSSISAQDNLDLNLTNENTDIIEIHDDSKLTTDESDCCEEDSEPQTYYVAPDSDNPNQVQKPTVQPVIDAAKPGDTIVLNGTFVHCHFMINKTLTILAMPGTSVGVCPHHTHLMKYGVGPSENGIFYISPEANGTVLSGFSFTNDFYYIANNVYNPFGVYVDAKDVTLENLTFNWVGISQETSKFNLDDFLFNSIILNNSQNVAINNIVLGNVNTFIKSANSSNINVNNVLAVENKVKEILSSIIVASNLNIKVTDSGSLRIILKDANNNPISNKNVHVIIDGESKVLLTNSDGMCNLPVKYATFGTHYATLVFEGDNDHKSTISTVKIIVTKKTTSLTVPKVALKVKKIKTIKITLKSSGKIISGKKITIKVNGKTFSAKTNSKGVSSIKVKVSRKGTFKYSAKFAGDSTYDDVSKSGKIVVKK